MNRRKKNEEIRRAAQNAQVIHRENVTLMVAQVTLFKTPMLFCVGKQGALFIPRGHNIAKTVSNSIERIRSGTLEPYNGPYKDSLITEISKIK